MAVCPSASYCPFRCSESIVLLLSAFQIILWSLMENANFETPIAFAQFLEHSFRASCFCDYDLLPNLWFEIAIGFAFEVHACTRPFLGRNQEALCLITVFVVCNNWCAWWSKFQKFQNHLQSDYLGILVWVYQQCTMKLPFRIMSLKVYLLLANSWSAVLMILIRLPYSDADKCRLRKYKATNSIWKM